MVEIAGKCKHISANIKLQHGIIFHTLWRYKLNHNNSEWVYHSFKTYIPTGTKRNTQ